MITQIIGWFCLVLGLYTIFASPYNYYKTNEQIEWVGTLIAGGTYLIAAAICFK